MNSAFFHFANDESEEGDVNKNDLLLEAARFADKHGFSAIWTPDRHIRTLGGHYPDPSVASAAIAAITDHVQIPGRQIRAAAALAD